MKTLEESRSPEVTNSAEPQPSLAIRRINSCDAEDPNPCKQENLTVRQM